MESTITQADSWKTAHMGEPSNRDLLWIRELYELLRIYPTSTAGDTVLIRSHIAYWRGPVQAARVTIRPSRGHTYRVCGLDSADCGDQIAVISDYYDHRDGVAFKPARVA